MELILDDLQFPTSVAFDGDGVAYVAESGLDATGTPGRGRVLRVDDRGGVTCLHDDLRAPINGLTFDGQDLYVAEGGCPGRLSRLGLDGTHTVVLDGLPGGGSYHTNMIAIGPDERLYFGQGALTNSGIIGSQRQGRAWPRVLPADIPGMDVVLTGADAITDDPREGYEGRVATGAFAPFAEASEPGRRLRGRVPCTAAVLSCRRDGSDLRCVAWGLRNAYGLGFVDGRLLALDLGCNDRGSRPIGRAPSCLYEVIAGAWYGWPDFVGRVPVTDPRHAPARGERPRMLLANHDKLPDPREPLLRFPIHASPVKFAVHPGPGPWTGHLFVALFGDKRPFTAPPGPTAGRAVARVDPRSWSLHPAMSEGLHRPIDLCFHPRSGELFVLDFGEYEVDVDAETHGRAHTGRLWRIPHGV